MSFWTLDFRVFSHEEKCPSQGGGCGFWSSHKQIQDTHDQIFFIKCVVILRFILWTYVGKKQEYINIHPDQTCIAILILRMYKWAAWTLEHD